MRDLAGKRALVTGAASGIGRAIAHRLADERCDLFLLDIDGAGLAHTAAALAASGVEVVTSRCDLADTASIDRAVDQAISRWAGVDLLVNNAGVTYYGHTHEMAAEHWDRLMAVNLLGPVHLTRALLPALLARPEAHVLNVCSVLGLIGLPRVGAYCTSKFGLVGFSETLRAEYNRVGLGVTALCPGLAKTNLFAAAERRPGADAKTPPAALCTTPERVARAALRAIKRNQAVARVEPFSRLLYAARQNFPTALDWLLQLGRRRRIERQRAHLQTLSADPVVALRKAGVEAADKTQRRAAA
ncbi:MAG: SDR family oxidoreductase [Planctomycetota bacterium]